MSVRFLIFCLFLVAPLSGVSHAHAAAYRASCDGDFHEVLEARAWMLAAREYETAQEFLEPARDSVLLLTCHDYSFDDYEGDEIVKFEEAIDEFVSSNFTENCRDMNDVWTLSKCGDFDMTDFVNFNAGEYQEPRSCPNPSDRTDAWDAAEAASQPAAGASGGMEAVVTYLDKMSWLVASDCGGSDNMVKTGVVTSIIHPPSTVPSDDAVCIVPGCYYNGYNCQGHP